MSKQAFKRVRRDIGMEVNRKPLDAYAWPGGYPMAYILADGCGALCPECANSNIELVDADMKEAASADARKWNWRAGQWAIAAAEVNWEDTGLHCENCWKAIESAYGEEPDARPMPSGYCYALNDGETNWQESETEVYTPDGAEERVDTVNVDGSECAVFKCADGILRAVTVVSLV